MKATFLLLNLFLCFFVYILAGANLDLGIQAKLNEIPADSTHEVKNSLIQNDENRASASLKATNSSFLNLHDGFLSEDQIDFVEMPNKHQNELSDDTPFHGDEDDLFASKGTETRLSKTPAIEKVASVFDFSLSKKSSIYTELEEKVASELAEDHTRKQHELDQNNQVNKNLFSDTNDPQTQDSKDDDSIGSAERNAELIVEVVASANMKNLASGYKAQRINMAPRYTDKNSRIKTPKKEKNINQVFIQKGSSSPQNTTYYTENLWKINKWPSVLTVFLIGFIIIFSIFLAEQLSICLNKDLKKTLDGIFRDTIVLAIIIVVISISSYYHVLSFLEYYINIQAASIGLLFFGVIWAALGLLIVLLAHFYIRDWRTYEKEYQKREAIFRHYEDLYYNPHRTSELNSELKHRRRQLEFFLIRQEFITPSFLPILGEDFLRDDFDFASYLAKCISKVNQQAFRFDLVTFLTFSLAVAGSSLIYYYIRHLLIKIAIFAPFVLYIPLRILARKMTRIYGQLVTVVKSPYDIDLAKFENLRQPLINLDKLSMPTYLTTRVNTQQYRRTCSIVQLANRHMMLYWFSSPRFMIRMLHVILILHLLWVTYLAVSLSFGIEKIEAYYYWIALVGSILVSLVNLFYTLPQILRLSAIVNNLQMLKDRKLSREVVEEKMQSRTTNLRDIYSVIKTVKRQSIGAGKDNSLRLFVIDFVRELFQELRGPQKDKPITCSDLTSIAHLCGRDLSDREATILAHDIICKSSSDITFEEFMDAVEKISDDVRSNPVEVSKAIFKELTSLENTAVSSRNLRLALEKLDLLEEHEIEALVHEVKYLPVQNAEYGLDHIATLIRDSIEGMPR